MTLVLCIKRGHDREQFMRDAIAAGVDLRPVKGLSRHFTVHGYTLKNFPLKAHSAIDGLESGDAKGKPTAANSFTIAGNLTGGNWAIARHVRRAAPWNVDAIKAPFPSYYRAVRDGTGVDIYSIDSAVRTTHDEFTGRITEIYTPSSITPGHCTWVFSSGVGETVGIARGALLWNARWGNLTNTAIINAMGEVLSHYDGRSGTDRPAVLYMSFFAASYSSTMEAAVDDMIDAGIVCVCAAANDLVDLAVTPKYPAVFTDVICVGGLGMNDTPYYHNGFGTNYGSRVDILAGSQRIYCAETSADDAYTILDGTSFGSPITAGVIACMLQGKSRLTTRTQVQAVKAKLLANATTGKFRAQSQFGIGTLPDRILYLDPDASTETIDGVS